MEHEINKIYHNDFGIAFKWKNQSPKNKTQMVFRNMGFYLTTKEIKQFYKNIHEANKISECSCCDKDCTARTILLKTPSSKIDLALNKEELALIEDLIKGTLFQIDLNNYLNTLSID